jgi:hypothetical protein
VNAVDTQAQSIEQERRRIGRLLDEVARLCESDVPPAGFYGEMLKRLLDALAAPAGAVWLRSPQGAPRLFYQIGYQETGVEANDAARQSHDALLNSAFAQPRPIHLMPRSGIGAPEEGKLPAGNPTAFMLLLVPIVVSGQVFGLIEIWQGANRPLNAVQGFTQYMGMMADLCVRYQKHQKVTQLTGQQQLWTQLESFARNIHGSLSPVEVSYSIVNEARRLIECDRVSAVLRYGKRVRVEAISGADVVERRSALVQLMRTLVDSVIEWDEKLVFNGVKDDSLPPKVLEALDAYLAESSSKLLVVQPLHDDRDGEGADRKKARSALVMEAFDPPEQPQQLIDRLDIVGRHAGSALYNAVEYKRIPLRFVWKPIAAVQEGLGGTARTVMLGILVGLTFLISVMVFWTYPLKMDSNGQALPVVRRWVYAPREGKLIDFRDIKPNDTVTEGRSLAVLFSSELKTQMDKLRDEILSARREAVTAEKLANAAPNPAERAKHIANFDKQLAIARMKSTELSTLIQVNNADTDPNMSGFFYLRAPQFTQEESALLEQKEWTVLNANFIDDFKGRTVKPNEPILRLGAKKGPWELELKIPQKHIGQVRGAFRDLNTDILEVDFLLRSDPTRTFRGKLYRNRVAAEANANREEGNTEAEPTILAYVQINEADIPADKRVPKEMLISSTEVHAKVRCGNKALGYSLFYGVWEFIYEKVVFFF